MRSFSWWLLPLLCGCPPTGGDGTLAVQLTGSSLTLQGITAAEMDDAYSARFTRLLVTLGHIRAITSSFNSAQDAQARVFNVLAPGITEVTRITAAQGSYVELQFRLEPARSDAQAGNASEADRAFMVEHGYSIWAEGDISRGSLSVPFALGLTTETDHRACPMALDISPSSVAMARITLHGEHLFRDSLASRAIHLRGETLALAERTSDADPTLTAEDLAAISGTAFASLQHADVGPFDSVENLLDYVIQALGRMARVQADQGCGSVDVAGVALDGGR